MGLSVNNDWPLPPPVFSRFWQRAFEKHPLYTPDVLIVRRRKGWWRARSRTWMGAEISRRAISAKPSSTERWIAATRLETRLRHLSTRASQVAQGRRCRLALQSIL